jgi:hypothetical protein
VALQNYIEGNTILDTTQRTRFGTRGNRQQAYNRNIMSEQPSPVEPPFATAEEAEDYDRWFRAKVHAALNDPRPTISHEDVMEELEELVSGKPKPDASDPMGD